MRATKNVRPRVLETPECPQYITAATAATAAWNQKFAVPCTRDTQMCRTLPPPPPRATPPPCAHNQKYVALRTRDSQLRGILPPPPPPTRAHNQKCGTTAAARTTKNMWPPLLETPKCAEYYCRQSRRRRRARTTKNAAPPPPRA